MIKSIILYSVTPFEKLEKIENNQDTKLKKGYINYCLAKK